MVFVFFLKLFQFYLTGSCDGIGKVLSHAYSLFDRQFHCDLKGTVYIFLAERDA